MDESPESREPSHRPILGAEPKPVAYALGINVVPPIRLEKRKGMEFSTTLAATIEPESVVLESSRWEFVACKGELTITVRPDGIDTAASYPTQRHEWFERQYMKVLETWEAMFTPKFIALSRSLVRYLMPIDGDARQFLANHIMSFPTSRLEPIGRPLHVLGMRMFFPPFATEPEGDAERTVTPWQVDVKLESWMEDPSQLFVEADAAWPTPEPWSESAKTAAIGRLAELSDFLRSRVTPFFQHGAEED